MKPLKCTRTITVMMAMLVISISAVYAKEQKPKKNTLFIHGRDLWISWEYTRPYPVDALMYQSNLIGASYERVIYKHLTGCLSYNEVNGRRDFTKAWLPAIKRNVPILWVGGTNFIPHEVRDQRLYRTWDLSAGYFVNHKRMRLTGNVGISNARFGETIIDTIIYPRNFEALITSHSNERNYWGVVPALRFDYSFFKGRLVTGYCVAYRKYYNTFYANYENGFYVGFRF